MGSLVGERTERFAGDFRSTGEWIPTARPAIWAEMMRSTDANGNVTRWNYYPDGLLRQKTYANGDSDLYVYDAA